MPLTCLRLQTPEQGGLDGKLRQSKQEELEKLIALRDAHKHQEREKKITAKYHKVRGGQRSR